ncbi:MAG TPA: hypothetical protein VFX65_01505 [Candidatus Limnocylindrales bacterium]|nr:hypothetical protein [Candidatus Limnocylindrales bacterium]
MQSNSKPSIWRTVTERRPLLMSVVVLGWSTKYFITLALGHSSGPELYGVLTAALSIGAAVANLALLRSPRLQVIATAAVLILWAVVALGGIAGTIAHVVGPVPGHGPIDLRPRPIAAPLAFTLLGSVGALALFLGQRARARRSAES